MQGEKGFLISIPRHQDHVAIALARIAGTTENKFRLALTVNFEGVVGWIKHSTSTTVIFSPEQNLLQLLAHVTQPRDYCPCC